MPVRVGEVVGEPVDDAMALLAERFGIHVTGVRHLTVLRQKPSNPRPLPDLRQAASGILYSCWRERPAHTASVRRRVRSSRE